MRQNKMTKVMALMLSFVDIAIFFQFVNGILNAVKSTLNRPEREGIKA